VTWGSGSAKKLQDEPNAEEEEGWDLYEIRDEKNGYKGEYFGMGIEEEIGTHDSSNCSAGPDCWKLRVPVKE
jgi:hypothetical protein